MDLNLLHNISYGMYIVCANQGDALNGQIVNTLFQITSAPVTVAVSINKNNLTHDYIRGSRRFSASILLEETPLAFIGTFGFKSGRDVDKLKETRFKKLASGVPVVLDYCMGYLEAEVKCEFDCGTHTVFLGEMKEAQMLKSGRPMTYDYYHQVKRGTTPAAAPTYIQAEDNPRVSVVRRYRCTVCNYIYDPDMGDPDSGIAPGTAFEQIPGDWRCPVCGVSKDKFVPLD